MASSIVVACKTNTIEVFGVKLIDFHIAFPCKNSSTCTSLNSRVKKLDNFASYQTEVPSNS